MKVIIAGSRNLTDYALMLRAMGDFTHTITEIVSGCATGADQLGERYAQRTGIPVKRFPVTQAAWNEHGKAAGPMRNRQMAQYADALIAIWDGQSKGTGDMISQAKRQGLTIHIHRTDGTQAQGAFNW